MSDLTAVADRIVAANGGDFLIGVVTGAVIAFAAFLVGILVSSRTMN